MEYFKVWEIEDVNTVLKNVSEKMGLKCTIPVEISGRMTRSLGMYTSKNVDGNRVPVRIKFSKKLLDGRYDEETVKHVIIHEYIHYYTDMSTNKKNGHNKIFKKNCETAGICSDTYLDARVHKDFRDEECKIVVTCMGCKKVSFKKKLPRGYNMELFEKCYKCRVCKGSLKVEKS